MDTGAGIPNADNKKKSPMYDKKNNVKETKEVTKKHTNEMIDYVPQKTATEEINQMTTYYPQYYVFPTYNVPVVVPDWSIANTIQAAPVFPPGHIQLAPQIYTSICPYTSTIFTEPLLNPVIPNAYLPDITVSYDCEPDTHCDAIDYENKQNESGFEMDPSEDSESYEPQKYEIKDPIELFMSLPKELFPSARTQIVDPNPLIDQFCKLPNIASALDWILDVEFGSPKVPGTRSIAVYSVKDNNVCCKNTSKVYPSFEACGAAFKGTILYYYKRIMYKWFKGYVIMNHDKSLENFQRWLLLPMHKFGFGWR